MNLFLLHICSLLGWEQRPERLLDIGYNGKHYQALRLGLWCRSLEPTVLSQLLFGHVNHLRVDSSLRLVSIIALVWESPAEITVHPCCRRSRELLMIQLLNLHVEVSITY